jgi:hypothetical protein
LARSDSKTIPTGGDVHEFIAVVPDEQRRRDAQLLAELFVQVTGEPPVLWGTAIVGFGSRHYRYDSGREGDVPAVSFSPRKAQTVLYLTGALAEYEDLLSRLGPYKRGKGCLYLKQVDQVETAALQQIATRSHHAASRSA